MANAPLATIRGTVVSFNLSPKAVPEGLLVRVDASAESVDPPVVQVNFEPELAARVLAIVDDRAALAIDVRPFPDAKPDAAHVVYELVRLATADGATALVADGPAEAEIRVSGRATRLNYARRGEVNGAILDSGDFIHLRPHGAQAVGLEVGQTLEVTGEVRAGWSGHRVIEARIANGIEIGKPPKHHHGHGHGHGHEDGHRHGPHHRHGKPRGPHHRRHAHGSTEHGGGRGHGHRH